MINTLLLKPVADQSALWKKIDKVLWEDWDPIGVNDYGGPDDEYRSYVPSILKLLMEGQSIDMIAQKLDEHASISMGLIPDKIHSKEVAGKLIAIMKELASE